MTDTYVHPDDAIADYLASLVATYGESAGSWFTIERHGPWCTLLLECEVASALELADRWWAGGGRRGWRQKAWVQREAARLRRLVAKHTQEVGQPRPQTQAALNLGVEKARSTTVG